MRETTVENYLTEQVRLRGGNTFKLAPIHAGMPDRLVLLPGGLIFLVELKAPRGRLRPAQVVWHARAAAKGTKVRVLYDKAQVDIFLSTVVT